jgi:hypothetical protein
MAEQASTPVPTLTSTTETVANTAENTGGDPSQAVSSAKGENAVSTSNTEGTAKTFTQDEVDALIKSRLEREKKGMPTKEELKAFKAYQDSQKTAEQLAADKLAAIEAEKSDAVKKSAVLEAKVTAFSKGVKAEAVEDVIALAMSKVSDDTDIGAAIDIVVKKYPSFCGAAADKGITTGVNFSGADNTNVDGVTAAFLAKNPGMKI